MSIIIEKKLISLNVDDSVKNNGTYLSDVTFNFTNVLNEEESIIAVEGGLYNAQFVASFYIINYSNKVLYYILNSITYFITLTEGNYNYSTLATEMTSKFAANGHTITITINKNSGVLLFTNSTGTLNSFRESGSTIWNILGFQTGSGNFNATANTIMPPFLLNLMGTKKIKIYSTALGVSSIDSRNLTSSLVDCLSVNQPAYSLISFDNTSSAFSKLGVKRINAIDIQIKDETNQLLDFHNTSWSITLALLIYRKVELNFEKNSFVNTVGTNNIT